MAEKLCQLKKKGGGQNIETLTPKRITLNSNTIQSISDIISNTRYLCDNRYIHVINNAKGTYTAEAGNVSVIKEHRTDGTSVSRGSGTYSLDGVEYIQETAGTGYTFYVTFNIQ